MQFKKIYIEITNRCNLNCDFCVPTKRAPKDMKKEEFEHILEQILPYTRYIYLHVKGEPFMHPEIDNFIKMAHEKGFNVNLTSNGTLIENHLNVMKYVRQLNVSLHATNSQKIIDVCKGITNTIVNFRIWTANENSTSIKLLEDSFNANIYEKLQLGKKDFAIKDNFFISVQNKFEWPDIDKSSNNLKDGYCHALKDHIAILVDGTVVPCCLDNDGNINLGNIFENDLKSILTSEKATSIRNGFSNRVCIEPLCQSCTYKLRF